MTSTRANLGARTIGSEIIAALMHSPRTQSQLQAQVGATPHAIRTWLQELRNSGVIRISGYRRANSGPLMRVYSLQTSPFALPDVATPEPELTE